MQSNVKYEAFDSLLPGHNFAVLRRFRGRTLLPLCVSFVAPLPPKEVLEAAVAVDVGRLLASEPRELSIRLPQPKSEMKQSIE
ncbi:hypothetical protein Taro_037825 [Colocasia esculenta]|uniref:Uncharacterized protein n=1 Tax=Colocasia esculenta TaxID=4460 RepID=A0A843W6K8_COLES|nr:hypothetical protein [Colocasia esculenta]